MQQGRPDPQRDEYLREVLEGSRASSKRDSREEEGKSMIDVDVDRQRRLRTKERIMATLITVTIIVLFAYLSIRESRTRVHYEEVCLDSVLYIKFENSMTVKYTPEGRVATCEEGR